jgi:hypothetical protein
MFDADHSLEERVLAEQFANEAEPRRR